MASISAFLATKAASVSSFDLLLFNRVLGLIFGTPSINLPGHMNAPPAREGKSKDDRNQILIA
jgi:hypothetical protein